ncbi:MAG: Flp pilus assembly protein CpaB [Chloroflexota bacterium]|jgi:pilus assembly protein CpaB
MRKRSALVLVFAVVLGAVAAVLVWSYMQQLQQEAERIAQSGIGKPAEVAAIPVVVATQDIPARTKVTASMVAVKQMPPDAKHANAFAEVSEVEGKVTKLPITAGEQVISNKFVVQREEAGLAFTIPPSKRAVAITVNEVIGAGGLIVPGDYVDVIGVFDKETMGKDMAAIILQNMLVLSVAQSIEGELPPEEPKTPVQQVGDQIRVPEPTPTPVVKPKAMPEAKTVTLAVTPEEAQRLVLAEARGTLRLALRPAKEVSQVSLEPALLGAIQSPMEPADAIITGVDISPTNARVGDTMVVRITVKNTSTKPLTTQGPGPEFAYVQGQTFHSQNFPSQDGSWRVGINLDTQTPVPFPYRWGFGGDLPPGASTTVTGAIKLTYDLKSVNMWAGLIKEPSTIVQDHVGITMVTVVPSDVAVISVDVANVRSGPSIDSGVIAQVEYGTQMPIIGQQADWYRVKLSDGREGYVAAGWIVAPRGQ